MANEADGISGVVINEETVQNMTITIQNELGEVVKTIDAGTQPAGNVYYYFDFIKYCMEYLTAIDDD